MKLDIKKIALILAASIFAIAGVFGQDEERSAAAGARGGAMGREKGQGMGDIKKIKVTNEVEAYKVDVDVNKDKGGAAKKIEAAKGTKEESIPEGIETVDITIDDGTKKDLKKKIRAIRLANKCRGENREACRAEIKKKIGELREAFRERGITATADVEGDTLVLKFERGGAGTAETKGAGAA